MLLAFDVGNSNIVLGVFKDRELLTNWRIETDTNKSADEYGMVVNQLFQFEGLKMEDIDDIIISTVVPSVLFTLQHLSMKYFNKRAIVVESGVKTGLIVKYDNPKQVGADRIVNAFAAYSIYKTNCIVVDFGTATSFDIVTEDGKFQGGVIAAGMKLQAESLKTHTSKLPLIKIEAPKNAIGKNSIDAMLSGTVRGHACMVDGMLEACEQELGVPVKVIATGGYSEIVAKYMKRKFDCINPWITLEGLRLINEFHSKNIH